jgi:hypothetical protein
MALRDLCRGWLYGKARHIAEAVGLSLARQVVDGVLACDLPGNFMFNALIGLIVQSGTAQ